MITEWYDETEPPPAREPIHEEDRDMAWSRLMPGMRVRWKTPNWIKRGHIVKIKGRSMVLQLDFHDKTTVVPDAKWYFVQGKMHNLNEHLVVIATPPPERAPTEALDKIEGDYLSPVEAANVLGTDQKNIRRMIRSGRLPAKRVGGRWAIDRSDLGG